MLVADEVVAIEGVGGGQRDSDRDDGVDRDIGERNAEGVNPGRIVENLEDIFGASDDAANSASPDMMSPLVRKLMLSSQ